MGWHKATDEFKVLLCTLTVWAFPTCVSTTPAADFCCRIRMNYFILSHESETCSKPPLISSTAFNTPALDLPPGSLMDMGFAITCSLARHPRPQIQFLYIDPVLVHRLVSLLHASFRPHLAMMPLRFAITSPPSVCEENFHLQAVKHARRSNKKPIRCGWACETYRERLRKSRNAPPHTSARKADNNRCSRWRDCSLMRQTTGIKSGMSSCG
jgi:hypothetical protein